MIYTIEQIKNLVVPIAVKYELKAIWLFGSYARGEATEKSDVDILMDYTDSKIHGLWDFNRIEREFEEALKTKIDLITTFQLFFPRNKVQSPLFIEIVSKERIMLYEKE
jgi:predicted nucleotidyltransferase